jgi:hypothetical protein
MSEVKSGSGGRNVLIGKKINLKAAGVILEKLKEETKDGIDVSLRAFIAMNRDALSSSGKNIKELYEYLKAGGLDVGTYHGFQSACYRAGLRQRARRTTAVPREPTGQGRAQKPQQAENPGKSEDHRAGQSKYNPALPPVFLPGGVEAIIDPETGAKSFEIKSGKESGTA